MLLWIKLYFDLSEQLLYPLSDDVSHCSRCVFVVPDLTPPPAPAQSRHGLEAGFQNASRCRGPGCGAIGKAMLEGYCDKCYVKEQSTRLNQVAHRSSHSPPPVMVRAWNTLWQVFWLFLVLSTFAISWRSVVALQFPIIMSPSSLSTPSLPLDVKRDRAVKPRSSQQSQTQNQTQCWRSGCSNVSPGCTDLCPECHTRGQGREVGRRAQAPKEKSKQRCRTQGCDHYANQEKQGYCNECDHFKQIYRGWPHRQPHAQQWQWGHIASTLEPLPCCGHPMPVNAPLILTDQLTTS